MWDVLFVVFLGCRFWVQSMGLVAESEGGRVFFCGGMGFHPNNYANVVAMDDLIVIHPAPEQSAI